MAALGQSILGAVGQVTTRSWHSVFTDDALL